jgi:large subunit ribosomal protein L6
MSKIGKINISIPEKVKVALAGNILNIEGPLGKKSIDIDLEIFNLDIKEGKEISIKPKKVDQDTKRLWGMNRSLINNAVIGSSEGYEKILELIGVGYRAALKGNQLNLQLGYSHDINFNIPEGIKIIVEKQTTIKISGSDKQQVGSVASKLKTFRKIEPYKGKGVREKGQYVMKKEGKKK